MFVVEVTPLIRGTIAEILSYYASTEYPLGSIIQVPIRNKEVPAVVVKIDPVSAAKTALRAATFSLKKITPQEQFTTLPENIIATAVKLLDHYPATLGAILFALLPPDIKNGINQYPDAGSAHNHEDTIPAILTGTTDTRRLAYKSYIREAFAHRGSVLLVAPTSIAAITLAKELSNGIEKRVVTLTSTHTKTQLRKAYEAIADLRHAKLIVTTPNYAMIDRHDLTRILIDECGSTHYFSRTRPYLDTRTVLRVYAAVSGKSLLMGDTLPRTEEEYWRRNDIYSTHGEHPKRHEYSCDVAIHSHAQNTEVSEWRLLTPEVVTQTNTTLANKGRIFYYAARKGLAPLVLCHDCGKIFRCPDSGTPYSLHRTYKNGEEIRYFISRTSGRKVRAADTCDQCGSWRLREQGVGVQQIEDIAREEFPNATIIRFDQDTASTHKKALALRDQFYSEKSAIMIGTKMSLPYLHQPVDCSVVTSYEAMRAVPTWRAEESTLHTLLDLRGKTKGHCLVQTREPADQVLTLAKKGQVDQFYDDEIAVRESVVYPPKTHFVLLTYTGTKEQVLAIESDILETLARYDHESYNSPLPYKGNVMRHTLIRVPHSDWPNTDLMETLRHLSPAIKIEIDPEKLV